MKFCVKKLQRRDEDQCEAIDTEIPNCPDADDELGFWLRIRLLIFQAVIGLHKSRRQRE